MDYKWKKILIIVFLFILFIPNIFVSSSTHKSRGGDFRGFLIAGDRFINGDFLYEGSGVATNVTWPPFFAVFIVPFSLLARLNLSATQVIWYIINAMLLIFTIDIWCRLFYNKPFTWFNDKEERSFFFAGIFVPLIFVTQPIFKVFVQLQMNILILFLMSLSFLHLKEKKDNLSGFWLGLATAIKVFPVLVVPYFIFRRKYKALVVFTFSVIILTLIPMFRYGYSEYLENIMAWVKISLAGGYPIGGLNQSVYAMLTRWIASDPFTLIHTKLAAPPVENLSAIISVWLHRGLYLLTLSIFFLGLAKKKYNFVAVEAAFLITIAMVFSPIAWKNYWIIIFPSYFVLYNLYLENKEKIIVYGLWISFFLITVLNEIGKIGKTVRGFFQCVLSNLTMGALLLTVLLVYAVYRNYDFKGDKIANK